MTAENTFTGPDFSPTYSTIPW